MPTPHPFVLCEPAHPRVLTPTPHPFVPCEPAHPPVLSPTLHPFVLCELAHPRVLYPAAQPFVSCVVPAHPRVLSQSQKTILLPRRWCALDYVIVAVSVYGMSVWTPAKAKHLAQLAELCQCTLIYCRAPRSTHHHVSSVSFLMSCLTIRQHRLALALPSSPTCCIKCWCVKQMCIANKLSHT
jgi:hypothetical protein